MENQVKHRKWRNKLRARNGPDRIRLFKKAKARFDRRRERIVEDRLAQKMFDFIRQGNVEQVVSTLDKLLRKPKLIGQEGEAVMKAQSFLIKVRYDPFKRQE